MTIQMRWTMFQVFLLILVCWSGWCSEKESQRNVAKELEGEWRLIELHDLTERVKIPAGVEVSFRLEKGGRISGCSGVNRFFGKVKARDGQWQVKGPLGGTMMAGEEAAMHVEMRFLKGIKWVTRYKLRDDELELTGKGFLLKLKRVTP